MADGLYEVFLLSSSTVVIRTIASIEVISLGRVFEALIGQAVDKAKGNQSQPFQKKNAGDHDGQGTVEKVERKRRQAKEMVKEKKNVPAYVISKLFEHQTREYGQ